VLLVEIEHQRDRGRSELYTKNQSGRERVDTLKRAGVNTLVCAGISNILRTMLEGANIGVRPGVVGQVEEVISAYLGRCLDDSRFVMPGHGWKRGGRSGTAPRRPPLKDGGKTGRQTKQTNTKKQKKRGNATAAK
jgi:predicted Fe-Mo cluster-binding NifX family protein